MGTAPIVFRGHSDAGMEADLVAIEIRYSKHNATSGGDETGTAALSLGVYVGDSASIILTTVSENLFDNVDAGEAGAGDTEYRCIGLTNANTVDETNVQLYFTGLPTADTTFDIAARIADCVPTDQSGTWQTGLAGSDHSTPDEDSAPLDFSDVALTFDYDWQHPTTSGTAMTFSQIPAGYTQLVWMRRVVGASNAGKTGDGCKLSVTSTPAS